MGSTKSSCFSKKLYNKVKVLNFLLPSLCYTLHITHAHKRILKKKIIPLVQTLYKILMYFYNLGSVCSQVTPLTLIASTVKIYTLIEKTSIFSELLIAKTQVFKLWCTRVCLELAVWGQRVEKCGVVNLNSCSTQRVYMLHIT